MHVDENRLQVLRISVERDRERYQIFLNTLAGGREVNVRSTKELPEFLYNTLNLPPKKNRTGGVTADQDAIIDNIAYVKGHIEGLKTDRAKDEWKKKLGILQLILKLREKDKLLSSYLKVTLSDGKIRSMYRVDGTESGRLSAKKFVDDSGLNIQTIPRSKVEVNENV